MSKRVIIVGGGLAGSEAAWQIAQRGIEVHLFEMRPRVGTAVHKTGYCAELVCSNSLGTNDPNKAPGLLKQELRRFDSLLIRLADSNQVPAGQALAVNREKFARAVTEHLEGHPRITIVHEEVKQIPEELCVLASGPLTGDTLAAALEARFGTSLYYYDAVAPIVTRESLDLSKLYFASRYGHGKDQAYLNAPFTRTEYETFVTAIQTSDCVPYAPHEDPKFFEACMPVEELVSRGTDTLRFGPMKPVGLADPRTGRIPYAVLQLRRENEEGTLYNLVGFQSRMKWGEQARVFRIVPGLGDAEFVRYGVMHRNIFVNSPRLLHPTMELKSSPNTLLAGQITGVEGYVEDIASGLLAGLNAVRKTRGEESIAFPKTTAIGALMHHITHADPELFQPMNINFGLFPSFIEPLKNKSARLEAILGRARKDMIEFMKQHLAVGTQHSAFDLCNGPTIKSRVPSADS